MLVASLHLQAETVVGFINNAIRHMLKDHKNARIFTTVPSLSSFKPQNLTRLSLYWPPRCIPKFGIVQTPL